ncbi:MAG: transglutaminase-like domain-containing protein [Planctomycetota bacterium]
MPNFLPCQPAYCRPAAFEAFRQELPAIDTPEGLLRAATAISLHAEPDGSVDEVVDVVQRLARSVRQRLQSNSQRALLAHLHDVLFDVIGFRGVEFSTYYDAGNSYLPRVLNTRRGIPITLTLVYRSVASSLGLRVEGVNSPGHFLAAVTCHEPTGDALLYVDPFFGGALLTPTEALQRVEAVTGVADPTEELLVVATPHAWLSRMLLNLQAVFARQQQERDLLAMQELSSLLNMP